MKRTKVEMLLLALLALLFNYHSAACSPKTMAEATTNPAKSLKPATFEVGALSISPDPLMLSDIAEVSATVTNIGDVAGTYTAVLTIDGKKCAEKQTKIEPMNSVTLDFRVAELDVGKHEINLNGSQTSVTVYDWVLHTISYCKGQSEWTFFAADPAFRGSGDIGQTVYFVPPATPFKIQRIRICGEATTEQPQDLDTRRFTVTVWNKDRSKQLWSGDFPWRIFEGRMSWRTIAVPDVRVEDDFYVEVVTHGDTGIESKNYIYIAFELARDALVKPRSLEYYRKWAFDSHSGWSVNGKLYQPPGRNLSLNWYIRVDGEGRYVPEF